MSELNIDAIKARLEAAVRERGYEDRGLAHEEASEAWSALYEHAPEDIRALLAEVKAVRDAVARHPDVLECSEYSDYEPVSCGWKHAYEDVVWALNGGKE